MDSAILILSTGGGKVSSTQPFPPYSLANVLSFVGREWSETFPPVALMRIAVTNWLRDQRGADTVRTT